jgi:hypothetical protein
MLKLTVYVQTMGVQYGLMLVLFGFYGRLKLSCYGLKTLFHVLLISSWPDCEPVLYCVPCAYADVASRPGALQTHASAGGRVARDYGYRAASVTLRRQLEIRPLRAPTPSARPART